MPYKDADKQKEWNQRNGATLSIRLMNKTDHDIMEWAVRQENVSGAIKAVLRDHIQKEKRES